MPLKRNKEKLLLDITYRSEEVELANVWTRFELARYAKMSKLVWPLFLLCSGGVGNDLRTLRTSPIRANLVVGT